MKSCTKFVETYGISEKYINSKNIFISKIIDSLNFLWKFLHNFSTGIIGIAFWCNENGRFKPLWHLIFYEVLGDLLVYLMQSTFFLDYEQISAIRCDLPQFLKVWNISYHFWYTCELTLVYI
jgi:hypothetical protein